MVFKFCFVWYSITMFQPNVGLQYFEIRHITQSIVWEEQDLVPAERSERKTNEKQNAN